MLTVKCHNTSLTANQKVRYNQHKQWDWGLLKRYSQRIRRPNQNRKGDKDTGTRERPNQGNFSKQTKTHDKVLHLKHLHAIFIFKTWLCRYYCFLLSIVLDNSSFTHQTLMLEEDDFPVLFTHYLFFQTTVLYRRLLAVSDSPPQL